MMPDFMALPHYSLRKQVRPYRQAERQCLSSQPIRGNSGAHGRHLGVQEMGGGREGGINEIRTAQCGQDRIH